MQAGSGRMWGLGSLGCGPAIFRNPGPWRLRLRRNFGGAGLLPPLPPALSDALRFLPPPPLGDEFCSLAEHAKSAEGGNYERRQMRETNGVLEGGRVAAWGLAAFLFAPFASFVVPPPRSAHRCRPIPRDSSQRSLRAPRAEQVFRLLLEVKLASESIEPRRQASSTRPPDPVTRVQVKT